MNDGDGSRGRPLLIPLPGGRQRPDTAAQQLAAIDALTHRERLLRLSSADRLRELDLETLVTAARWLKREGWQEAAGKALGEIVTRAQRLIEGHVGKLPYPPNVLQQIREDTVSGMLTAIWSLETKYVFWEVNFRHCLKCTALKAKVVHARSHEREESLEWEAQDGELVERAEIAVTVDPLASFEKEQIRQIMSKLTDNERLAITLQVFEGFEVESRAPDNPSISTVMKKSGRMVRNYLNSAREKLAVSLKELGYDE